LHGIRPYHMGVGLLETHRTHPSAKADLVADLQREANEVANQRIDNVKLALNGRNFVKRGANVDTAALLRSVPGGNVFMNDPEKDVVIQRAPDVTASSYQEQNLLNLDFDEILGAFSPSSVQAN